MKRNAIFRVILWSITLVILMGLLVAGMTWSLPSVNRRIQEKNTVSVPLAPDSSGTAYAINAGEIRDLEIDWLSGNIEIRPADVKDIQVAESPVADPQYAMVCKQEGNTLKIAFCERTLFGDLKKTHSKDLSITVPKDWDCRSLEVDAASSTLYVEDLNIREVELDTASGENQFQNCTVDSLDIDTASGDIRFTGTLNRLDCDSASAGVYADLNNVPTEIDMDTASGAMELVLPKNAGFSVKTDSMSGSFDSDFPFTVNNGKYVSGNGACRIDMSSMSGGVTIRSK